MLRRNSALADALVASTLPERIHSPSPHLQDSLGGGIQVHNNRTRADDDDAVPNTVDGPGDVTRALSEVLEVTLGAKRLLQVRDQGTHQLHALSCIERDRALWCRYKEACRHRTVGKPHE